MGKRKPLAAALMVLVLGACGGGGDGDDVAAPSTTVAPATSTSTSTSRSTSTSTSTTTIDPAVLAALVTAQDSEKIKNLYRAFSDAWDQGADYAAQFVYDHNYPVLRETETLAECRAMSRAAGEGFTQEAVVDGASIERQDGWDTEIGNLRGPRQGRTYVFKLTTTQSTPGYPPVTRTDEVHASVLDDGNPYFFILCEQ